MRSYPAAFTALMANASSAPYHVLEIQWGSGDTDYYLDRASTDFEASGTRVPAANVQASRVLDWGSIGIDLKENSVGGVDQTSIKLFDDSGELRAKLAASNRQRKTVKVYRMFDDATCTWSAGAATVFVGSLKPSGWTEQDNVVTLTVQDSSRRLVKDVSHVATQDIFDDIGPDYRDRNLPIVMGRAERVPAILVSAPWETRTLEALPGGTGAVTVDIQDHPDDIGIPTGTPIDVFVGQDQYSATFSQSGTPASVPSTMTLSAIADATLGSSWVASVSGTGSSRVSILTKVYGPGPRFYPVDLEDVASVGTKVKVYCQTYSGRTLTGWQNTTIASINRPSPSVNLWEITFSNGTINAEAVPGDSLRFYETGSSRPDYEAGTIVRPIEGDWIYVANSLPSKAVIKVEGFGTYVDEAGGGRQDFILLGKLLNDDLDGSVVTEDTEIDPFTVNLRDDTWLATLGHCCTTITFEQAPRMIEPGLHNNQLWVSLRGCEDNRDSTGALIDNPALIILEYLENPDLMDVAAGDIDSAAFTAAAASLSAYSCGFAQLETVDGLAFLQDIARQCHSVLLFDQGKVSIVVLSNSAGTSRLTLNNNPAGTDNILERSLSLSESDVDDVVSQITARWRRAWDDISGNKLIDVVKKSSGAESEFGVRNLDIDYWIYWRRSDLATELAFQSTRNARIFRHVRLTTFLCGVALQPGDWITVSFTDGEATSVLSSKACEVLSVMDTGRSGLVEIEARYALFSY